MRNTTEQEAAIMLRLAKAGVPAFYFDELVPLEVLGVYSFNGTKYQEGQMKDALTKQIAFGRSEPKSISGPLFDQPGLFD